MSEPTENLRERPIDEEPVGADVINYPQFGPQLNKILNDCFFFVIGLKSGMAISGQTCRVHGEWLVIDEDECRIGPPVTTCLCFEKEGMASLSRGVEIRISEIAWIADSPIGS